MVYSIMFKLSVQFSSKCATLSHGVPWNVPLVTYIVLVQYRSKVLKHLCVQNGCSIAQTIISSIVALRSFKSNRSKKLFAIESEEKLFVLLLFDFASVSRLFLVSLLVKKTLRKAFQPRLNSSPIDELGHWCLPVGGAGQCSSMRRRYPWQPCEQPPPRHRHTEQISGILTDPLLT